MLSNRPRLPRRAALLAGAGPRSLAAARDGVAALEFGLIAPVMAILTIGVFDLSKALVLWKDTWAAARSISESATTLAIQANGSSNLTEAQAQQALSSVFAEMPWLRAGVATGNSGAGVVPPNTVSAVLTSVSYAPSSSTCTSGCTYVATVQWSKAYSGHNFITTSAVLRPCSTLTQVSPGTTPSLSSLPIAPVSAAYSSSNANSSDAILLADVTFKYTPFFFNFITGPITLQSSAYLTSRSNYISNGTSAVTTVPPSWVTYTPNTSGDSAAAVCTYTSSS